MIVLLTIKNPCFSIIRLQRIKEHWKEVECRYARWVRKVGSHCSLNSTVLFFRTLLFYLTYWYNLFMWLFWLQSCAAVSACLSPFHFLLLPLPIILYAASYKVGSEGWGALYTVLFFRTFLLYLTFWYYLFMWLFWLCVQPFQHSFSVPFFTISTVTHHAFCCLLHTWKPSGWGYTLAICLCVIYQHVHVEDACVYSLAYKFCF